MALCTLRALSSALRVTTVTLGRLLSSSRSAAAARSACCIIPERSARYRLVQQRPSDGCARDARDGCCGVGGIGGISGHPTRLALAPLPLTILLVRTCTCLCARRAGPSHTRPRRVRAPGELSHPIASDQGELPLLDRRRRGVDVAWEKHDALRPLIGY